MAKEVTVIGAGIVGMCAASYLQRAGLKVKVIDERPPGMATSYGNAGGLSSGGFVPLSYPGIIKQAPDGFSQGRAARRAAGLPAEGVAVVLAFLAPASPKTTSAARSRSPR